MNLFNRYFLPFLMTAMFFGLFLVGCLDAPDYPETFTPVDSIRILVKQKGDSFSTLLKVHPSDSATVTAKVIPEKYQNDLTFEWFYTSEKKDSLLGRNTEYSFYAAKSEAVIPNKLITSDKEGNKDTLGFNVIINSPPVLSDSTIPGNGDTLYGSQNSAFLFAWYSIDMDMLNNDTLFHILEIDDRQFDVGTLLQVKQSGLKAGKHKFRIIVQDLYGDTDTLDYRNFYVIDTLEAK